MGIFADKCRALIDPETGRALSGDKLKEAQKDGPDDKKAGIEQGALGMMRAAATGQNGGAAMFMGVSFLVFTLTIILVVPESRHLLFNIFT